MNTDLKYIVVDDDPLNIIICSMILEDAIGKVDIITEDGFAV